MEAEERPTKIRRLSSSALVNRSASPESLDHRVSDDALTVPASQDALSGRGQHLNGNAVAAGAAESPPKQLDAPQMSKSQLKRLRKQQEWEAGREERKERRKEKDKARKERKRVAAALQSANGDTSSEIPPPQKIRRYQLPITILFDCGFQELMTEKERISLVAQLTRSYSENSKALFRAHIAISSFGGELKERFDNVLDGNYKRWKGVKTYEEDFAEVARATKAAMASDQAGTLTGAFSNSSTTADTGEVVYLTADCDETLEELRPYSTYIIGGLVDRNRHKGVCYQRAVEKGIKTAKLPIGAYLQMNSRAVLATNHVNEIMLKWLELRDWGEAFMQVIPKRKGGVRKSSGQSGEKKEITAGKCGEESDGSLIDDADSQKDGAG